MSERDEMDLTMPEPEEEGEGEEEILDGTKAKGTAAGQAVEEEEAGEDASSGVEAFSLEEVASPEETSFDKEIPFDDAIEQGEIEATEEEIAEVAAPDGELDKEVPAGEAARIDLNTAGVEELQELPGIGPALAESIVAYREDVSPFKEAAEIVRVAGISEGLYARIADLVTVSIVEPATAADEAVDGAEIEPELETMEESVLEPEVEVEKPAEEPRPKPAPISAEVQILPASRGPGWGSLIFIGLLSLLAGAVLALGVLFAVNGTLDFDSAISRAVQAETSRLDGEIESLHVDLAQAEGRLQSLQRLAPELEDAKAEIGNLEDDLAAVSEELASVYEELDTMQASIADIGDAVVGLKRNASVLERRTSEVEWQLITMQDQLAELSEEVRDLRMAALKFDGFLDGLRDLLNETQGPVVPTRTPWVTPTASPAPTTDETPTLRPMVTVIPLATATPMPTPTP